MLLAGSGYFLYLRVLELYPCARPIDYSIGSVDPRFGISRDEFASAVREASALWSQPVEKPLFREVPEGGVVISAIFDYRQEAELKMKSLGMRVDDGRKSYDALQEKYDGMRAQYEKDLASLRVSNDAYEREKQAYQADLDASKQRGLSPQDVERLEAKRLKVNGLVDQINVKRDALKTQIDEMNSVFTVLSRLGSETNRAIDEYNNAGDQLHDEYEAALYIREDGKQRIEVFTFDAPQELKHLLTHEFGHALGLQHVADSGAIMYRLNQHTNAALNATDVAALRTRCGM